MKKIVNNLSVKNLSKVGLRKLLALFLLPFVAYGLFYVVDRARTNEIYAVDPIVVTYNGHTTPDPIFEVYNMLPGDIVEKTFNVKNGSSAPLSIVMDAVKTSELKNFSDVLDIEVTDSTTTYFSGKLDDFFALPPVNLGNFTPGMDKNFKIKVIFLTYADNEYQEAKVVFNIIFRTDRPAIELPPECKHLNIVNVIEGTEKNDDIRGTVRGDLILAKGGRDKVDGVSGDDCIVGGAGDDKMLDGGSGRDVVLGGAGDDVIDGGAEDDFLYGGDGNDKIDGGSGNDKIYGGAGNDEIDGASQNDLIYGEAGDDTIKGGSGDDIIYASDGADNVWGDSGDDKIYGENGKDKLYGNSGNDYLNGGADMDYLHGDTGVDTCVFGETRISCEF